MATVTKVRNGYTFRTDTETGTTTASGRLQNTPAPRNAALQREAGGASRLPTDHGGHLVGARMNGPAIEENHFAQDGGINQGSFKALENAEQRQLNRGATIETERIAYMSEPGRPSAFLVNDTITYASGKRSEVHYSVTNLSKATMDEIEAEAARLDVPDDTGWEEMKREIYTPGELALIQETADLQYPSIREEFEEPAGPGPESGPSVPDLTDGGGLKDDDGGGLNDDDGGGLNDDDDGGIDDD